MATPASHPISTDSNWSPRRRRRGIGLLSLTLVLGAAFAASAQAAPVGLGTADGFSVLGGSSVSNTGPSVITGDLGVSPGTAVTGFPPGTVLGTIHASDAVALQAKADLVTAYNDAAGRPSTSTVSGDLAGRTLVGGVYTSATSLGLTGDLTLDAQGDPNAVFVFQAGSTLTTGSASRVLLIGGAQACNVFWKVGSSATIGTSTAFTGNILALTSISLTTGATLNGRALARNGAVTLDTNTVTRSTCSTGGDGSDGGGGSGDGSDGGDSGDGSGDGSDGSSTTVAGRGVITGPSTHLCPDNARRRQQVRLEGTVRRGAAATKYHFQFGRTTGYGRRTSNGHLGSGTRAVAVHAHARRLQPGTTYHYRVVGVSAGSGGQRTYGADRTFRTGSREVCRATPARTPRVPRGFTG